MCPFFIMVIQKGLKAYNLLKEYLSNGINKGLGCLEACSYMSIKVTKAGEREEKELKNQGRLILSFRQKIHKTEAYYLYEGISLVADTGGFVGLFLGASVYQMADLFESFMSRVSIF